MQVHLDEVTRESAVDRERIRPPGPHRPRFLNYLTVFEISSRPTPKHYGLSPAAQPQRGLEVEIVPATLENHQVVAPAYFSHHWCEFWLFVVGLVEEPHSPEVRSRITADARKLTPQILRQLLDD